MGKLITVVAGLMGENQDTPCKCNLVGKKTGSNQPNFSKIGTPVLALCVYFLLDQSAIISALQHAMQLKQALFYSVL